MMKTGATGAKAMDREPSMRKVMHSLAKDRFAVPASFWRFKSQPYTCGRTNKERTIWAAAWIEMRKAA